MALTVAFSPEDDSSKVKPLCCSSYIFKPVKSTFLFIYEAVNQCQFEENVFQGTDTIDLQVGSALEWEENSSRIGNNT